MAAVMGADDDAVDAACQRAEGEVWVANYNAPGQVVIAGTAEAVARAGAIAKELGARKVLPIPVAGAFHTMLMAPARSWLRKSLASTAFSVPEIPVIANVDARAHTAAEDWPGLLSAQLCSPVRWRQSLETLAGMGATRFVEVGTGGVLTGLARRTLPDALASAVATPDDLDTLVNAIAGSETWNTYAAAHQGEHLYTSERVVISPSAGVFEPVAGLAAPGPGGLSRRRHRRPRLRRCPGGGGRPARHGGDRRGPHPLRRHGGGIPGPPRRARGGGRAHRVVARDRLTARDAPRSGHHRMGHSPARHRRHQRATRGPSRHHRRVDRHALGHPGAAHRGHRVDARHRRRSSRPRAGGARPRAGGPAGAGHVYPRPGRAGHLGGGALSPSACRAEPSTSTRPAPGSSTRSWPRTGRSAAVPPTGCWSSGPTASR